MKKTLDKKEKLLLPDQTPVGKNDLSSRASFMQEKLYHQKAFSDVEFYTYGTPVDFYYDAPFYGRIDESSFAIRPKNRSLKQLKQSEEIVKCQNFVADAFSDFYEFWQLSKRRGFLNESSPLYNLDFISGYVEPVSLYREYIQDQNSQFLQFIQTENLSADIKNFSQFVKQWMKFVDGKVPLLPFTFSSFQTSRFSDPRTSGLIIDLADEDLDDDKVKYEKYIGDSDYIFFYNSAVNFGFSIDRKLPWRLVSNLDSVVTKEYLEKYNLNNKNIYNNNFNKIYLEDLDLLSSILISFYKEYLNTDPYYVKKKISSCYPKSAKIENNLVFRDRKTDQSEDMLLRLYLFLKARENNLDWDQAKFDNFYQKTLQIYKNLDIDRAMDYAHKSLNVKTSSKKKNVNFSL